MLSNLTNLKQINVILIILILIKCNVTKVFTNAIDDGPYHMHKKDGNAMETQSFQEFFIEHIVTRKNATKAFWDVGVKLLEGRHSIAYYIILP